MNIIYYKNGKRENYQAMNYEYTPIYYTEVKRSFTGFLQYAKELVIVLLLMLTPLLILFL